MTKTVRIENADNSDHKLIVYTEELNPEGIWVRSLEQGQLLRYPTAMLSASVWATRRLVVEEIQ
jgi:hypothetical protein